MVYLEMAIVITTTHWWMGTDIGHVHVISLKIFLPVCVSLNISVCVIINRKLCEVQMQVKTFYISIALSYDLFS